jgi:hypothetical protein
MQLAKQTAVPPQFASLAALRICGLLPGHRLTSLLP